MPVGEGTPARRVLRKVDMIDTSATIEQSKTIQATKVIYIRRAGALGLIISDGRTAQGKWHIIDMAFGDTAQAVSDLKRQGYLVREF